MPQDPSFYMIASALDARDRRHRCGCDRFEDGATGFH